MNNFYVDDLLTGSNDLIELNNKCKDIYSILKSAYFIFRKWVSNDPDAISGLNLSSISNSVLQLGDTESCKTLGIQWITSSDTLHYNVEHLIDVNSNVFITKRHILSVIVQIYDPLGLLSPFIITGKIIIKCLWRLKTTWDTPVNPELEKSFLNFKQGLSMFSNFDIPRNIISKDFTLIEIHSFCDASMNAYAACIYLRCKDGYNNFQTHLLCSKTKVAPLKSLTIPKLELCACLLGSQLISQVKNALNIDYVVRFPDSN